MALRFDMSKGDWQRDYLMQQQMNQGVNPYKELGENLATGAGAVGGALGKVIKKKYRDWQASGGTKKLRQNFPNWFTEGDKFAGDAEGYKKAHADWLETEDAKAGTDYGKPNPKDYGLAKDGGLYKRAKFTPFKGLLPEKGKNLARNLAAGAGIGASTIANPIGTAAVAAGLYAGHKNKDKITGVYDSAKTAYDRSDTKKYLQNKKQQFKDYTETDHFAGEQDSALMKAIKKPFQKRKSNKLIKEAKAKSNYYGVPEDDELDLSFSTIPTQDDYTSALDELAKRNMKPTIGNLKKVADNKLPPVYDDWGSFEVPEGHPDYYQEGNSKLTDAPALINPRATAAKNALLLEQYGPLQSLLKEEDRQRLNLKHQDAFQSVDSTNVKPLPPVNPFQRGMR